MADGSKGMIDRSSRPATATSIVERIVARCGGSVGLAVTSPWRSASRRHRQPGPQARRAVAAERHRAGRTGPALRIGGAAGSGLALYHSGYPARGTEEATDSSLPDFNAALSCVVYTHFDRRRKSTSTLTQGACAGRVNMHSAKWHGSGHDRRATGAHHGRWDTSFRFQRCDMLKGIPFGDPPELAVASPGRPEGAWQINELSRGLAQSSRCRGRG